MLLNMHGTFTFSGPGLFSFTLLSYTITRTHSENICLIHVEKLLFYLYGLIWELPDLGRLSNWRESCMCSLSCLEA